MQDRNIETRRLESLGPRQNPIGLKLKYDLQGNTARTGFTLNENHQGLSGYVHDGIITLLMDEGMGWIARHGAGVSSVTASLQVNFHDRARIGEPLIMVSQITKNTRRLLEEAVRITRQDGTLIAEGTCLQYVVSRHPDANKTNTHHPEPA